MTKQILVSKRYVELRRYDRVKVTTPHSAMQGECGQVVRCLERLGRRKHRRNHRYVIKMDNEGPYLHFDRWELRKLRRLTSH